jgi:hypothetical protein
MIASAREFAKRIKLERRESKRDSVCKPKLGQLQDLQQPLLLLQWLLLRRLLELRLQ